MVYCFLYWRTLSEPRAMIKINYLPPVMACIWTQTGKLLLDKFLCDGYARS